MIYLDGLTMVSLLIWCDILHRRYVARRAERMMVTRILLQHFE